MFNIHVKLDTDFDIDISEIENAVQQELIETAKLIEEDAKTNCPVDTGYLRKSIKTNIGDLDVEVGTSCSYAPFVHDGTHKMPARPFLDSAAETNLEGIEDRIADAIARKL
jgi:HK97 gp10 family phage protein